MTRDPTLSRRQILSRAAAASAAISLAACDRLSQDSSSRSILEVAESLTRLAQRALIGSRESLAPEYSEADISKVFKPNGSTEPDDPDYAKAREEGFANWKLVVDGLVERPQQLSLKDLRALPSRTQITRHDCVEGWSCIGKWTG